MPTDGPGCGFASRFLFYPVTECDSRCRKTGSALSRNTGSVLSQKKPCSEKTGATEGAADENATVAVAQCEEYLKKIFSGNATVGVALFEGICNPMERQKGAKREKYPPFYRSHHGPASIIQRKMSIKGPVERNAQGKY